MKKSVIITIIIVYIIAIFVVGFIGMEIEIANELVPVDGIVCLNEDAVKSDSVEYDYQIKKNFVEGLKIELKCKVIPDTATQKKLEYRYDEQPGKFKVTVNPDGTATIEILKPCAPLITVKATDNNGKSISIKILVR